jgi:GTP-binding protein Era
MNRAGVVAIIGAPNAGKSTLTNRLVGEKVSIVTHKVQTTRFQVRGIAMVKSEDQLAQLVLVDTPGIFTGKERMARAMVEAAWQGVEGADVILHVVDASALVEGRKRSIADTNTVIDGLKKRGSKAVLALNQIDRVDVETLLPLVAQMQETGVYKEVYLISALNGDGVEDLANALAATMPEGPLLYPEDQAADLPMRVMAAEITREKLFLRLHEELPYSLAVETEGWEDFKDGSVKVSQVIYVTRSGHKGIVLGRQGETIKAVNQSARKEMTEWLGRKVHLFLFVKVRENWQDDRARYEAMNLNFHV